MLATNARTVLPWDRMFFFWGDERHVPPTDPDSNYRMAQETMLSKIPVPPGNVFRMAAENPDAAAVAEDYEKTLRKFFELEPGQIPVFDLILLGMGPDGHTASLFPGTAGLQEKSRLVIANWVEKMKTHRLTFTLPVLNAARCVAFLVSGTDKAAVLRTVLEDDVPGEQYPAKLVHPNGWKVDLVSRSGRGQRTFEQEVSFGKTYPRQSPISFKPLPRACSNRRTRWRECSNSWMSAQTSACQPFSWAEDSPQVAQRVCRVTGIVSTPTGVGSREFDEDATNFLDLFVRAQDVLVAQQVSKAELLGLRLGLARGYEKGRTPPAVARWSHTPSRKSLCRPSLVSPSRFALVAKSGRLNLGSRLRGCCFAAVARRSVHLWQFLCRCMASGN